jgi:hypothetical protein
METVHVGFWILALDTVVVLRRWRNEEEVSEEVFNIAFLESKFWGTGHVLLGSPF